MNLTHHVGHAIEAEHDSVTLFRYVTHPQTPAIESPRPYIHPLRTLKGNVVSGFRPHDHRWHHGMSMTSAYLSGHNFWGGPTFIDDAYRQLENNGYQRDGLCNSIAFPPSTESAADFTQRMFWMTADDQVLIDEMRSLRAEVFPEDGLWVLDWESLCMPRSTIEWGSPTTQGRENAGYGGLFWRGPRDFEGGKILMSEGREGAQQMGETSPWLAYIGRHDETDDTSTLVFIDHSQNLRHPSSWFVRNTTPMVCPNFAFHETYSQAAHEALHLKYRILIIDGAWEREKIEAKASVSW